HLTVEVRGPDGGSAGAVDSLLDRWGLEAVLLRPSLPGTYRIEVRAAKKGVGLGGFAIRLDGIDETTAAGRERASALDAMTRAGTVLRRDPTGSLDEVLALYEEARLHFRA